MWGRPQGECWIQALQKSENGAETAGYEQLVCGNSNVLEMKFDTVTQKKTQSLPCNGLDSANIGDLETKEHRVQIVCCRTIT